jgi:tRNA(fMet)-specific endonuclease VapC
MYLFDTDVLSNVVKKAPSAVLLARLTDLPGDMQFTTAINAAEIYYGAARSEHREEILKAFEEKVFLGLTILPFDGGSAKVYGPLKAGLERKGTVRSEPDLRIAAIAIQHRLILVTGNVRRFEAVPGLKFEDWINPIDFQA